MSEVNESITEEQIAAAESERSMTPTSNVPADPILETLPRLHFSPYELIHVLSQYNEQMDEAVYMESRRPARWREEWQDINNDGQWRREMNTAIRGIDEAVSTILSPNVTAPTYKTYEVKKLRQQKWYKENYERDNLGCLMTFYMKNYRGSHSINSLNYIRDLAGQSRTDISEWDLITIFCDPKDSEITRDRKVINKKFFAPRAGTEMIGGEAIEIKKGVLKKFDISKVFEGDMRAMISNMNNQLVGLERTYTQKLNEMNTARESYLSTYSAHRLLTAKDQTSEQLLIEKTLREIEDGGIFEVIRYDVNRNSFLFKNRVPFIMKLGAAFATPEIDRIDFGFFEIEVFFFTFDTRMTAITDKSKRLWSYPSYPGPFVNGPIQGRLCFGHEVSRVDRFLKTKDLSNHLRLVNEIMCQYEPGVTPYRDISYFIRDQTQMNRYFKSGVIEHVLSGKKPTEEHKKILKLCANYISSGQTNVAYDFKKQEFKSIQEFQIECPGCHESYVQNCKCPI